MIEKLKAINNNLLLEDKTLHDKIQLISDFDSHYKSDSKKLGDQIVRLQNELFEKLFSNKND